MNVEDIKRKQKPIGLIAVIFFVITLITNLLTFEDRLIENLNILINTISLIIFLLTAWITSYYFGQLEAKGQKVTWEAGILIVISGLIPSGIAFLIGKKFSKNA